MARSILTSELATRLETWWQIGGNRLTDQEICEALGIKTAQVQAWLAHNTKVERENGLREGLREIRTQAKAQAKTTYLQRLSTIVVETHLAAQEAKNKGDLASAARLYEIAAKHLELLMSKQFPNDFGNQPKDPEEESATDKVKDLSLFCLSPEAESSMRP